MSESSDCNPCKLLLLLSLLMSSSFLASSSLRLKTILLSCPISLQLHTPFTTPHHTAFRRCPCVVRVFRVCRHYWTTQKDVRDKYQFKKYGEKKSIDDDSLSKLDGVFGASQAKPDNTDKGTVEQ